MGLPPSSLILLELALGWPLSLGNHLEPWGGIAAKIQDHSSGWKRKPWGGNNWQIFVPMNKLPWISCYFNPSLLTEFSFRCQIDRFHHLRRNQNGCFFFFLIFSYYCIQIHESKAESTLPGVNIKMIDFQVVKFSGTLDKDSIKLVFCAATVLTNSRVSQWQPNQSRWKAPILSLCLPKMSELALSLLLSPLEWNVCRGRYWAFSWLCGWKGVCVCVRERINH